MQRYSSDAVYRAFRGAPLAVRGLNGLLAALLLGAFPMCASMAATNPPAKPSRGFTYIHDEVREVPWSIHVVKIERGRTDLELQPSLGRGTSFGMATVSQQVRAWPAGAGRPVAAINGDFYRSSRDYPGDPEGLQITRGELISSPWPAKVSMWIDAAGNPHRTNVLGQFKVTWPDGKSMPFEINEERPRESLVLYTAAVGPSTRTSGGTDLVLERAGDGPWLPLRVGQTYRARVREVRAGGNAPLNRDVAVLSIGPRVTPRVNVTNGTVLQLSTATIPDLSGARSAIGGGPTLVRGGKPTEWTGLQLRHPRSAVGWNKDYFFLVEVDGRQRSVSVGMTFAELAAYLVKLGCQEAINFDGGGSATLWALGNVMNSPSEGRERPAANALVLVRKDAPP